MTAEEKGYEVFVGLEVHVQGQTRSKMFCSCPNDFGGEPNTRICPVCTGYPGVLPVINREAVKRTVTAGLMCDCAIAEKSKFDRKNYYYPDMPKNYQISQYDLPICYDGAVPISGTGFSGNPLPEKSIGLRRIHLEEDVAKLTHRGGYSVIDYNRAGLPLLEIVSEPDARSPDEAHAYLMALKQIMQYAGVGECDMEKGHMRCDVNVSVRPVNTEAYGTKVELKNLNSLRAVYRALAYEVDRQIEHLEEGGTLRQETRRWDDEGGRTVVMRTKEQEHDYRYFPEPDLLPVNIDENLKQEIRTQLPESPKKRRERFVEKYGLRAYDAEVLTLEKDLADFYEEAAQQASDKQKVANWVINNLLGELNEAAIKVSASPVSAQNLGKLVTLVEDGTLSGKLAQSVFEEMWSSSRDPETIVEEKGLKQVTDSDEISQFVQEVLEENADAVEQYRNGKEKALQRLVGQVMKKSQGKANPQMVNQMLKERI